MCCPWTSPPSSSSSTTRTNERALFLFGLPRHSAHAKPLVRIILCCYGAWLRPEGSGVVCASLCVFLCVLVGELKECLKYVEGGGCVHVGLSGRAGVGGGVSLSGGTKHA